MFGAAVAVGRHVMRRPAVSLLFIFVVVVEHCVEVFQRTDIGKMEESILAHANVDKCGPNAGHDLGHATEIYVADIPFFAGGFYKELRKSSIFDDGDAVLVSSGIDDDLFAHRYGVSASLAVGCSPSMPFGAHDAPSVDV